MQVRDLGLAALAGAGDLGAGFLHNFIKQTTFFFFFLKEAGEQSHAGDSRFVPALTSSSPHMLTLESCLSADSHLRDADWLYGRTPAGIRLVPVGEQTGVCRLHKQPFIMAGQQRSLKQAHTRHHSIFT